MALLISLLSIFSRLTFMHVHLFSGRFFLDAAWQKVFVAYIFYENNVYTSLLAVGVAPSVVKMAKLSQVFFFCIVSKNSPLIQEFHSEFGYMITFVDSFSNFTLKTYHAGHFTCEMS